MNRDDLHILILAVVVLTVYIGSLVAPGDATNAIVNMALGGLLTLLVPKSTGPKS